MAEKGVTILERGIASTRWRDYVDIVQLVRRGIDLDELFHAASAVARHRGVVLRRTAPCVVGYGAVGQARWAAWRRKEGFDRLCEPLLDDQMAVVADCLDPVFVRGEQEPG